MISCSQCDRFQPRLTCCLVLSLFVLISVFSVAVAIAVGLTFAAVFTVIILAAVCRIVYRRQNRRSVAAMTTTSGTVTYRAGPHPHVRLGVVPKPEPVGVCGDRSRIGTDPGSNGQTSYSYPIGSGARGFSHAGSYHFDPPPSYHDVLAAPPGQPVHVWTGPTLVPEDPVLNLERDLTTVPPLQ